MYRSSIAMFISSNTFMSDKLTKKERSHLLCERMINIAVSSTFQFYEQEMFIYFFLLLP